MKKRTWIAAIIFIVVTSAYAADESASINQGVEGYDWQTCFNARASSCINGCITSENMNCKDACNAMARDKCLSEGLTPPQ